MRLLFKLACVVAVLGTAVLGSAADLAVLQNGFQIRHERREQNGATTRLFLATAPDSGYIDVATDQIAAFEHDDSPAPKPENTAATASNKPAFVGSPALTTAEIQQLVAAASGRHMVDADLIASVIRAESSFNARAVSPKGAQGLMQLMPGTAAKLGVDDPMRPEANVDGGTRYLRELLEQYNGDIVKALAAYNAGPHRVSQYGGVPPYRETHAYVARIVRDFNRKKRAARAAPASVHQAAKPRAKSAASVAPSASGAGQ